MVQKGMSFLWPGMSENREVEISEVGEGEPAEGFGSKLGEGRVKLDQSPPGLDRQMHAGRVIETDTLRDEIDPMAINQRRSEEARQTDAAKDAPITTDPLEWASDPSHFDFPGVDTGPTFRDVEGDDFDTESFLDGL